MDPDSVPRVQDRVLVLASSVDDVAIVLFAADLDRLLEDVFDRWVVRVYEGVLDVADDERGLACCAEIDGGAEGKGEGKDETAMK